MTPATASEPYAADAPPVTISVRSSSSGGIRFRSTLAVSVLAIWRRPSTSVSVRPAPSARRFAICAPTLKLPKPFVSGVRLALFAGICCTAAPTLTKPRSSK